MQKRNVGAKMRAETKLDRFERLATRRVTEALKQLRLVGNLSNRSNYDYTEEHVRQISEALEGELKQLKQKFRQEGTPGGNSFSFRK